MKTDINRHSWLDFTQPKLDRYQTHMNTVTDEELEPVMDLPSKWLVTDVEVHVEVHGNGPWNMI